MLQVFCGCPHRSLGLKDMEDRLAPLIFSGASGLTLRNVTLLLRNLAANVFESNNLFLETKVLLHSSLVNVYSRHEDQSLRVCCSSNCDDTC